MKAGRTSPRFALASVVPAVGHSAPLGLRPSPRLMTRTSRRKMREKERGQPGTANVSEARARLSISVFISRWPACTCAWTCAKKEDVQV